MKRKRSENQTAANAATKENVMKRFQLCASVTALIIGVSVVGNAQAGDKTHSTQRGNLQKTTQTTGQKITAMSAGTGVANNLKTQGNMKKLNTPADGKTKKIDATQL